MSWSSRKKKEGAFCTAYFVRKKFYQHLCFISMYSVLNKLSKIHILLHTKKKQFCLFLKSSKAFSVSLNPNPFRNKLPDTPSLLKNVGQKNNF